MQNTAREMEPGLARTAVSNRPPAGLLRHTGDSFALGLLAIVAPKCPLCFTVYCGALGTVGFTHSSWYGRTLWVLLLLVLGLFMFKAFRGGARRVYAPAVLAVTGTCALVAGKVGGETSHPLAYVGLALLLLSSCLAINRKPASASPQAPQNIPAAGHHAPGTPARLLSG